MTWPWPRGQIKWDSKCLHYNLVLCVLTCITCQPDVMYSQKSLRLKDNIIKTPESVSSHDDVIKWKHFPRYWPFVWRIHRSPMISPHKGQRRGALMFSLICVWINGWVNNGEAGDLRRYRAHYDVTVMRCQSQHSDALSHTPTMWRNTLGFFYSNRYYRAVPSY